MIKQGELSKTRIDQAGGRERGKRGTKLTADKDNKDQDMVIMKRR